MHLRSILLALVAMGSVEAAEPSHQILDDFVTAMRHACFSLSADESRECLDRVRSAMYVEGTVDRDYARLGEHYTATRGRPEPPAARPSALTLMEAREAEGAYGSFDLKGVRLLQPEALVVYRLGGTASCEGSDATHDRVCTARVSFGERPATATIAVSQDRSVDVRLTLDSDAYPLIVMALGRKFGAAASETSEALTNRMVRSSCRARPNGCASPNDWWSPSGAVRSTR